MSLLDDVSIVVTPNGYKAGELYAVVPVPTEGAELLTNGDFASDLTGWTGYGTTSATGGVATIGASANSGIFQSILTEGVRYTVTVNVTSYDGVGTAQFANNNGINIYTITSIGIQTFTFIHSIANSNLIIRGTSNALFSLSSVSVKEYTAADMDVTRATAGTRVDENGLVNYAEIIGSDLVTNGDFATDLSGWTTLGTNATNTITWESNGARIISTGVNISILQTNILTIGKTYKLTCDVAITVGKIGLDGATSGSTVNMVEGFNEIIFTAISTTFKIKRITGNDNCLLDNVSVKEVTRDNVPRIDYTGGGCPHILAEPQRTNLLPYSEDLTQWNKGNLTISSDAVVSPDGTQNADTLNVIDDNDFIYEGATTTASTEYVFSFYVKRGTIAESSLKLAVYDDTNNAFIVSDISYSSSDSEWTRVTQSFTTPVGCILIRAYAFRNSSTTLGTFSVWGAQVEESYATSYIPTSGSTVTRNKDQFTRDGIGSLINDSEGVLFVEFKTLSETGTFRQFNLSKDNSNRIYITKRGDNGNLECRMENPSGNLNFSFAENTTNDFVKVAFRYGLNNFAVFIDGVNKNVTATGNVFASGTLNTLEFDSPISQPFFGKVKQLQVYNTALTDAQLTSLTS